MIEIKYFARLSESLGVRSEQIEADSELQTTGDLIDQLISRGGNWAEEFDGDKKILVAVNKQMAELDASVRDGDEVAFFPPVTGG